MHTNGVFANAATASSSPSAGVSVPSGQAGSPNAFTGALVEAMGGTAGAGVSASGTGIAAGLLGLLGMFSAPATDAASTELLDLLGGLSDQLGTLDPNSELPTELQDQLASLLVMFQEMLKINAVQPPQDAGQQSFPVLTASEALFADQTPSSDPQMLMRMLQQTVRQLTDRLTQGETALSVQVSGLTDPVKSALNALQQLSGPAGSSKQENRAPVGQSQAADSAVKTVGAAVSASLQTQAATPDIPVQPEIRKAVVPLRNPVWLVPASGVTETASASTDGIVAAPAETSEVSGQNGPATVWTFQKDASLRNPVSALPASGVTETASASADGIVAEPAETGEVSGQNGPATVWTFQKDAHPAVPTLPGHASAPNQVPVQQFADQIGKYLVKQFILTQGNGSAEAKISLHPEHLGQVDIKIMLQNGQLTARFMTESGAARDLLENQMSQLRTALQGQGLQVDKMEVVQMSSQTDSASFFQSHQDQHGSGRNGSGPNGRGNRGVYEDSAAFEAELDRTSFLREIGFGSSLNVTA